MDIASTEYKYLVHLPFSSENLKYGFESTKRYEANRRLTLSLLNGQTNLAKLAHEYHVSYNSTNARSRTVLQFRDFLFSAALSNSLINTQYSNFPSLSKLTPHSEKVWAFYSYDDIWDYLDLEADIPDYKYAGLLGTAAYWYTKANIDGMFPIDALLEVCRTFWLYQSVNPSLPLSQRFNSLIEKIDPPYSLFNYLQTVDQSESKYLWYLRRKHLVNLNIKDLLPRILLGEYQDNQIELAFLLANDTQKPELRRYIKNCLSLAKPGGMNLVCQFGLIEALAKCSYLLTSIDESVTYTPLIDYLRDTNTDMDKKADITKLLSSALDFCSVHLMYGSMKPSVKLYKTLERMLPLWMQASNISSISKDDPCRINFLKYV